MKYDDEKFFWTVVASLPQYIILLTCVAQWRDLIFVGALDTGLGFLFNPLKGHWIKVNGDGEEGFRGMVVSAATVEI